MEADRADFLLGIVLDESAPEGDRYDAIMALEDFPDLKVRLALASIAHEEDEPDDTLVEMCAETPAFLWVKLGYVDAEIHERLVPLGRAQADAVLRTHAPHLPVHRPRVP
ncbi:hypothetical protein ACWEQL_38740 [Kitasatospora sp. NPDC004240]